MLVRGTSAQFWVRLLALASGLYTGPLLARHLGPARFGQLTLIFAVGSIVGVLVDGGLPTLVVRDGPTLPQDRRNAWYATVWQVRWYTATTAAIGMGVVVWALPLDPVLTWGLLLIAAGIPLGAAAGMAAGTFLADLDPRRTALGELANRVAWIIVVTLVVVLGGGVVMSVGASVLAASVGAVTLLALRTPVSRRPRDADAARLLRRAAPLAALPLLGLIYSRSDTVVLAVIRGDHAVGIYGLTYRVVDLIMGLTAVAGSVLLPKLSEQRAPLLRRWEYRAAQQWLVLAFGPLALAIAILAPTVLRLFGGAQYLEAGAGLLAPPVTLAVLMGVVILMLPAMANGALMLAEGMERQLIRHFLVSIVINLSLSLLLIPRLSYLGAALSTLLSEGFVVAYSSWALRQRLGPMHLWRPLRPIVAGLLAGSVAAAIVLATFGWSSSLQGQVGSLIAGAIAFVGVLATRPSASVLADMLDVLDPRQAGRVWHSYRLLRDLMHRRGSVPHAPKRQVDSLMIPVEQLLADGYLGAGSSERVIEIPWALSRYTGEERVLEVGYAFAEPRYLEALRRLDIPELHGFDQTEMELPWMVRHHGDIRDAPLPDATYDLVLCISTIEHIGMDNSRYDGGSEQDLDGDRRALAELARIVRPGGRIVLTVPYGRDEDCGWYRHYGEERWQQLLASVDCTITAERYFLYEEARGWRPADPSELRQVGYQDHGAPNAAGVACAELTREP